MTQTRHLKPGAKRKRKAPGKWCPAKGTTDKGGRPTDYKPAFRDDVRKYLMFRKDATDEDLALFLGCSRSTLNLWKAKHPEFSDAIRLARDRACVEVVQSMFARATGYTHKAHKFFNHDGQIISHEYLEHYPPDTAAGMFLLKNWQPDTWRDKQLQEHTGLDGAPIRIQDCPPMTDAQLLALAAKGKAG